MTDRTTSTGYQEMLSGLLREGNIREAIITTLYHQGSENPLSAKEISAELKEIDPNINDHSVRAHLLHIRKSNLNKYMVVSPAGDSKRKNIPMQYQLTSNFLKDSPPKKAFELANEVAGREPQQQTAKKARSQKRKVQAAPPEKAPVKSRRKKTVQAAPAKSARTAKKATQKQAQQKKETAATTIKRRSQQKKAAAPRKRASAKKAAPIQDKKLVPLEAAIEQMKSGSYAEDWEKKASIAQSTESQTDRPAVSFTLGQFKITIEPKP